MEWWILLRNRKIKPANQKWRLWSPFGWLNLLMITPLATSQRWAAQSLEADTRPNLLKANAVMDLLHCQVKKLSVENLCMPVNTINILPVTINHSLTNINKLKPPYNTCVHLAQSVDPLELWMDPPPAQCQAC